MGTTDEGKKSEGLKCNTKAVHKETREKKKEKKERKLLSKITQNYPFLVILGPLCGQTKQKSIQFNEVIKLHPLGLISMV